MGEKFTSIEFTEFCISIKDENILLYDKAQRILMPFSTSYLREAGFMAVAVIESKNQAGNGNEDVRVPFMSFIRFCSIFIRMVIILLKVGRHGNILIEIRRRD